MSPVYITAVDLGQVADYSAATVLEVNEVLNKKHYAVRHIRRWDLGTSYTQIVSELAKMFQRPPLPGSILCVDGTGVGRAVVDLLIASKPNARIAPVVITAGHLASRAKGWYHVPKKDLVGVVQVLLGSRRLTFANLPLTKTLVKELTNFKVKVNPQTGNETLEAWRESDKDDLVLALAIGCWYGERAMVKPRIIPLNRDSSKQLKIAVVTHEEFAQLETDNKCMLVDVQDLLSSTTLPVPGNMVDSLVFRCADVDPEDWKSRWEELVPLYNKRCEEVMLSREAARDLWKFLLKNRPQKWEVLVISGDDRALSLAFAISDVLRLDRAKTIWAPGKGADYKIAEEKAPNGHIYDVTKIGRSLLMM